VGDKSRMDNDTRNLSRKDTLIYRRQVIDGVIADAGWNLWALRLVVGLTGVVVCSLSVV